MFRDGPLSRRPPETIRYGTGRCVLGALLVASSESGIVSIMVRDSRPRLIRDLTTRFPKAELAGCARAGNTNGWSTRRSSPPSGELRRPRKDR